MTNARKTKWWMLGLAVLIGCQDMRAGEDSANMQIPFLQVGPMFGRDGAAAGPGWIVAVNPTQRIGLYGFMATSGVNGYSAGQGIVANFADHTAGGGIKLRIVSFHHGRFVFSFIAQAADYSNKVKASIPDGYGGTFEYVSTDREPLVTIGPDVSIALLRGTMVAFIRPGKNLGSSFAATTAGGFSLAGGVLFDVKKTAQGTGEKLGTGFRKTFHVKEPIPTI